MKTLIAALALFAVAAHATEYYKLASVKRIDANLYRSGSTLIQTRYCYHSTYNESALLKYEGPGEFSGSKIIWQDDSSCDVAKLIAAH